MSCASTFNAPPRGLMPTHMLALQLEAGEVLGEGTFGEVIKMLLPDHKVAAAKFISLRGSHGSSLAQLANEVGNRTCSAHNSNALCCSCEACYRCQ